ncbi:MAG: ATP-dependent DNA ligase [Acetobacteraceae bacterium]
MTWPVPLDLEPMEAEPVEALPDGPGWAFEPKYDGFRCVVFRDGDAVALQSRRQRPLGRFFPEVATLIGARRVTRFVLDGELIIGGAGFDTLQMRLHPAASRIAKLSREHPATFVAFDLLADDAGQVTLDWPFTERRAALAALFERIGRIDGLCLTPQVGTAEAARRWLGDGGHGLDGIVAKRLDLTYQPGKRAMLKYKLWHTVDCVVGGAYLAPATGQIDYLLLGLYDADGRLNYVGRCGPDGETETRIRPMLGRGGFTGDAPGGPSRWTKHARQAEPAEPRLVVEASADHITAGKFRHGSRLLRWRDDKAPRSCLIDQLTRSSTPKTPAPPGSFPAASSARSAPPSGAAVSPGQRGRR